MWFSVIHTEFRTSKVFCSVNFLRQYNAVLSEVANHKRLATIDNIVCFIQSSEVKTCLLRTYLGKVTLDRSLNEFSISSIVSARSNLRSTLKNSFVWYVWPISWYDKLAHWNIEETIFISNITYDPYDLGNN